MNRKSCALTRIVFVLVCGIGLLIHSSNACADVLATGTPTSLKVTVTKVELWNGSSWVIIFEGSSQLNLVTGGTFEGINDLNLPEGTYSKIRITIRNSFVVTGSVTYEGTPYYTTGTDADPLNPNTASLAKTDPAQQGEYTFYNPIWGELNAEYKLPEVEIDPPVTVDASTDYQPILRFGITDILNLFNNTSGQAAGADVGDVIWGYGLWITLSSSIEVEIVLPS